MNMNQEEIDELLESSFIEGVEILEFYFDNPTSKNNELTDKYPQWVINCVEIGILNTLFASIWKVRPNNNESETELLWKRGFMMGTLLSFLKSLDIDSIKKEKHPLYEEIINNLIESQETYTKIHTKSLDWNVDSLSTYSKGFAEGIIKS